MKQERLSAFRFEPLSEEAENLLGGFSATLTGTSLGEETGPANNCLGGNCIAGCGSGQEVNTVSQCGKDYIRCA